MRLIGVKTYNDIINEISSIAEERKDRKLALAEEKWRRRRSKVADQEMAELDETLEKDRERFTKKIREAEAKAETGELSENEYLGLKSVYEEEIKRREQAVELQQTNIELLRAEWAMEEMERVRDQERRMETIKQAMIERRRAREALEEATLAAKV